MDTQLESNFQNIIINTDSDVQDDRLLIKKDNNLTIHYAPFEYINTQAKLVIVGITPGTHQANVSLNAYRKAIKDGKSKDDALKAAKETASFSGPMRKNLIDTLNYIGVHKYLGINDCSDLFGDRRDLVHYTSALRNPVFKDRKNYSGSPKILKTDLLREHLESCFYKECQTLNKALYLPLGGEVESVLKHAVDLGYVSENQVLLGMPHPSGANAERIAYFLGRKSKEALSTKTNAESIDKNKQSLIDKIALLNRT